MPSRLDARTKIAAGCGRQAIHVETLGLHRTWMLNFSGHAGSGAVAPICGIEQRRHVTPEPSPQRPPTTSSGWCGRGGAVCENIQHCCVRRHSEFSVRKSAIPDFIQFFEAVGCHAPGMTLVASDAQRPRRTYDHRLREHVVLAAPWPLPSTFRSRDLPFPPGDAVDFVPS